MSLVFWLFIIELQYPEDLVLGKTVILTEGEELFP
jgi:hypothetical protein